MFRRKPKPEVTLTGEAFARWLRAHSPQPLAWFLALAEADQEAAAAIGDAYTADIVSAIGFAAQSPQAAAAVGTRSDRSGSAEAGLLASIVSAAAAKARAAEPASAPEGDWATPTTMGGIGARRRASQAAARAEAPAITFLGRQPDAPARVNAGATP